MQHHFAGFADAQRAVARWMHWYNEGRPQQALQYRSPRQYNIDRNKLPRWLDFRGALQTNLWQFA